jgi:hypothetical protein
MNFTFFPSTDGWRIEKVSKVLQSKITDPHSVEGESSNNNYDLRTLPLMKLALLCNISSINSAKIDDKRVIFAESVGECRE